jgi:hypothetical protein
VRTETTSTTSSEATFHPWQSQPTTVVFASSETICDCFQLNIITLRTVTTTTTRTILPHRFDFWHNYEYDGVPRTKWAFSTATM